MHYCKFRQNMFYGERGSYVYNDTKCISDFPSMVYNKTYTHMIGQIVYTIPSD